MIVYAGILLFVALLFGAMAGFIYKGKTDLIHDYHQTHVTDKVGYGKAFGKALGVIAIAMALSGVVSLFGQAAMWSAIAILAMGLFVGILAIIWVQKKYNGGII